MTIDELKDNVSNWKLTRHRVLDLTIGISFLLLLEFVAKPYYRSYIYSNTLFDFHIADTLGNSFGTVAEVFIIVGLIGNDKGRNNSLIRIIVFSIVVYELAQPLLGKPTDPWDVLATVLTGGLCFVVY